MSSLACYNSLDFFSDSIPQFSFGIFFSDRCVTSNCQIRYGDSCYQTNPFNNQTGEEAEAWCQNWMKGGHLVWFRDEKENDTGI